MDTRQAHNLRGLGRTGYILLLLAAVLLLGAWSDFTGNTINPRYVKRIQDGKTSKQEIILLFGDPKEIKRTDLGLVYKYFSYKDNPADMPYKPEKRKIQEQSDQIYLLDDKNQIKKPVVKKEGKIPRSTLTIRFNKDGDIVMSHEYQEF